MSTQNKDNSAKGQHATASNKGKNAADPGTDRTSNPGGGINEKGKGDLRSTVTGKVQRTKTKGS